MTPAHLLAFMSFGFTEILVVGIVALLVFGGQLPDVMRNVGRAYAKFRQGLHEISKPVREELRDVTNPVSTPRTATRQTVAPSPEPQPAAETTTDEPASPQTTPEYDVDERPRTRKAQRSPDPWLDDEPPPV